MCTDKKGAARPPRDDRLLAAVCCVADKRMWMDMAWRVPLSCLYGVTLPRNTKRDGGWIVLPLSLSLSLFTKEHSRFLVPVSLLHYGLGISFSFC